MKLNIIVIFIFLASFVVADNIEMSVTVVGVENTVITVCSSSCNFTKIQEAVDAATDGFTVEVSDGVYSYFSVVGKNDISIIGQSKEGVVIAGDDVNSNIVLEGVNNSVVKNFTVYDGWQGIWLGNSNNNIISDIVSYSNENNGFVVRGDSNMVSGVESYDNNFSGIYVFNASGVVIDGVKAYSNGWEGVYLYYCVNSVVNNSNISGNSILSNVAGLAVFKSNYTSIDSNDVLNNYKGIYFFEGYNENLVGNSVSINVNCDVDYWTTALSCDYDYTAPAAITDLFAYPGSGQAEVVLNWTAVGDNYEYGAASSYVLKYSNVSEVNSGNWDSSDTYSQSWSPSANGSLESRLVTMPTYDYYWFALKAQDDALLNSSISNPVSSVSPYHSLNVDDIGCLHWRTGYDCNNTDSSTNYFYDLLNISGNITNNGNLDENKSVEAKRLKGSWSTVDSDYKSLLKDQKTVVDGLFYNISDLNSEDIFVTGLFVDSSSKEVYNNMVWSIEEKGNLTWFYEDDWPLTNGIKSNETFRVAIKVFNNRQLGPTYYNFYSTITNIEIDNPFTVNNSFKNIYCDEETGNKTCYIDSNGGDNPPSTNHYWDINPLSAGTYTIRVLIGNPGDQFIIERVINIVDP